MSTEKAQLRIEKGRNLRLRCLAAHKGAIREPAKVPSSLSTANYICLGATQVIDRVPYEFYGFEPTARLRNAVIYAVSLGDIVAVTDEERGPRDYRSGINLKGAPLGVLLTEIWAQFVSLLANRQLSTQELLEQAQSRADVCGFTAKLR